LVVSSEGGEDFSFGGEVREWPGKHTDWFRTFIAEVNASYRALEILRVPTVAAVRGAAFGGAFELALSCDFLVAADNAVFRCIEVTTGFIPIAGGLQRLAERVGRSRGVQLRDARRADIWRARGQPRHCDPRGREFDG
jgi:enoyl-CoA hydratase/carnithine racemase